MIELHTDTPIPCTCGNIPTVSSYTALVEGKRRHVSSVRCLGELESHRPGELRICGRQIPVPMASRADALAAWAHMIEREGVGV